MGNIEKEEKKKGLSMGKSSKEREKGDRSSRVDDSD